MRVTYGKMSSVEKWLRLVLSLCAALMLFISFSSTKTAAPKNLSQTLNALVNDFSGKHVQTALLTLFFYLAGRMRLPVPYGRKAFTLLSALIAAVWLAAEGFKVNGKLSGTLANPVQRIKAIIYFSGAFYLIFQGYRLLIFLIAGSSKEEDVPSAKKTWFSVFFGLLAFWTLPVLISYPANMPNDSWSELAQYWGFDRFTSYHPPFFTFLIGSFSRLGRAFGNINAGLFLFVIFQTLLYAGIIAWAFVLLRTLWAPGWLRVLYFLCAVLSPFYANFNSVILKDSIYSIFFLLFTVELVYALRDPEGFFCSKKHLILSFIAVCFVILTRKNGMMLIVLFSLVLLVSLWIAWRKGKFEGKILLYILALFGAALILSSCVEKAVMAAFNGKPGPIREVLCLPFQQTARYVKAYGDEVTPEEKEAIDAVLDYSSIADLYDPVNADPVKSTFRSKASAEEIMCYLRIWIGMFFKHPGVCLSATLNQSYFLVYPLYVSVKCYTGYETGWHWQQTLFGSDLGFSASETILTPYRAMMTNVWLFMSKMPIPGVPAHPAVNILILLGLILLGLQKKDGKLLILCVPCLLTVFVVILAPCTSNGARYCFPIIYSMPVLIGYARSSLSDDLNEK